MNPANLRNIGISAHIDSGKTTLSERILFYAGRIHRMQEVRGLGATMDHMELEKERGITITSAATSVDWHGKSINLIDTPGHVDFTVEVERSLRVLDGAVLVLCAVGGVQAQSLTIDRQMRRYGVPRLAFINKMDRTGADPLKVAEQLREKLACDAVLMQLPIGSGDKFCGVIDLLGKEAVYFDGAEGQNIRREPIPAELADEAAKARSRLLESLAMYSDELMELLLEEQEPSGELIDRVVKEAVARQLLTPVYLGSAYRNKGVQPLLDAVVRYLPSPRERESTALVHEKLVHEQPADGGSVSGGSAKEMPLTVDADLPLAAMAFKIAEDPFGALTFMRIYQGRMQKGGVYYNQRTGRKERFSRIVRMHADEREEIDSASAGDIVAVLGVDCASGDTYCSEYPYCTLQSMHVPEPVIQMAVAPANRDGADRLGKALYRFRREDPTLQITTDEETGETLIAGMGELHLEVYVERIRREFMIEVEVGRPKVNYREAPTVGAEFNVRHKKQTGGSGQFAHIIGEMGPIVDTPDSANAAVERTDQSEDEQFRFEDHVTGGRIPKQYIPAVEKGFRSMLQKGPVAGYPVVGLHVDLLDGSFHEVDSSEMAFQTVARTTMREQFAKTRPVLLEPVMKLEVECPGEFQGTVVGDLTSRRGMITGTAADGAAARITAEIPLAETFGYATDVRSMTQGQGTFTLEFSRYRRLPPGIEREIIEQRRKEALGVGI